MELTLLALALCLLLALNAFFVLAEFAVVKIRPSRVAELSAGGDARADILEQIQHHLDEYLSVCQVGITLASIALGMVGTHATSVIMGTDGASPVRYAIAIAVSYVVVSGSHIVVGELVPKSVAIRVTDVAALRCARPLRVFRWMFLPALWVLTTLANLLLRAIGMGRASSEEHHSEGELRIILEQAQERGVMSFRRLLFLENVFDFGGLTVKDAMRPRATVRCLDARLPWQENLKTIRASHFTRYPLLTGDGDRPTGFVHLKDLLIRADLAAPDLRALARPILTAGEGALLEALLTEMQRKRVHAALVNGPDQQWTGYITFEDIIEELVGTIRDEFEDEEPTRLAEALTVERIHLDVEAASPVEAVRVALGRMKAQTLPVPAAQLLEAIEARERLVGTYLGDGVGMPHARIAGMAKPFVMILRSGQGVPCAGTAEKAHLLFVLVTPAGQPRAHQRLQSTIATLLHESEFVRDRLKTAPTAAEIFEAVRDGEQAVLD